MVADVLELIPLKQTLMSCSVEKFLVLLFDNQSEQFWENMKNNKNIIKEKGVLGDKCFVSRAKSLIKNLIIFGMRSNITMNTSDIPKSGEPLTL